MIRPAKTRMVSSPDDADKSSSFLHATPKIMAVFKMAIASSLHYAGYELARNAIMALFTSERTGFINPSAAPLCTACVSPFSFLLLLVYTRSLRLRGPQQSLRNSTLQFAVMLVVGACLIQSLDQYLVVDDDDDNNFEGQSNNVDLPKFVARITIFLLNVGVSSFVQLLSTQHWSFLGSICNKEGAIWFAPIAGLGSIASTLAAMAVSPLVDRIGLVGLLLSSSLFLLASSAFADDAYRIAYMHDFEPTQQQEKSTSNYGHNQKIHSDSKFGMSSQQQQSSSSHQKYFKEQQPRQKCLIRTATKLFSRVPVLSSLCTEVLVSQCVSSMINFLFVLKVQEHIPNDEERARWTGNCFAWINASSGLLQFFVLPLLVNRVDARRLWLLMPCMMLVCATLMSYQTHTSLHLTAATFALFKVLEYSVRGVTTEMVYVTLDYESRFVGKEIIGVFVNRVGKSSTAIGLSIVTSFFGSSPILDQRFVQALSISSLLWLFVSYPLVQGQKKVK